MSKPSRRPTPSGIELSILDQSRRRCTLCFHLRSDVAEKLGQIAHLDKNPTNSTEDNLAFMCMEHHSLYDSRNSQHKNYTLQEVKTARARLYTTIEAGDHIAVGRNDQIVRSGREADCKTLKVLVHAMTSTRTMEFMRDADFGAWSFHWRELNAIDEYEQSARGAEHEFIDSDLEAMRQHFIVEYNVFRLLLAQHTAPVRWTPTYRTVPVEWRDTQPQRHAAAVEALRAAADAVCAAYDELVRAARGRLAT